MSSVLKQALVEHMELVACANGAKWDHHIHCYQDFQTSVQTVVEEGDTFQALPGAFSSGVELARWAKDNGLDIEAIGMPLEHALITHGNAGSSGGMEGTAFIWVKATSDRYREAIVYWLNILRSDRDLPAVHKRAAIVYGNAASNLEQGMIRKKLSSERRADQVAAFRGLAVSCLSASQSALTALQNVGLLEAFDSTLDADHVINKQSLKNMPDAWVMLAPVIASSNRHFGRVIERRATQFAPRVGSIGLDAVTAFKLFAATLPSDPVKLEDQVNMFLARFIPRGPGLEAELQEVLPILTDVVNKTLISFVR